MLVGALATWMLGGPCTALFSFVLRLIERVLLDGGVWEWLARTVSIDALVSVIIVSILGGLLPSLGATFANTLLQERLQRTWGWDSWVVAALSGGVSGGLMAGTNFGTGVSIAMVLAGVLMGILYWSIAIKQRRNRRIAQA